MEILITGGTGLIGRHFINSFQQPYQFTVLTRNSKVAESLLPQGVDFIEELPDQNHYDVIINLAGEPIVDKRWTEKQKDKICQSRWQTTEQVVAMIERAKFKPQCLISGSAVGYYGETGDVSTDENSDVNDDGFAHTLCKKWESIALQASEHCRVALLRTGMVLANDGGALTKMRLPFSLGLGGKLGDGHQYMSWIHIEDMVHAIHVIMLTPELEGAINCTSPHGVTNTEFTKALGKQLHRPTALNMPAAMLDILMGQGAEVLLSSQNIYPKKLLDHDFDFNHGDIHESLANLL